MPIFNVAVKCNELREKTHWLCIDADSEVDARLAAAQSLDSIRETAFYPQQMRELTHCVEMPQSHRLFPREDMVDIVAQRYGDELFVDVLSA